MKAFLTRIITKLSQQYVWNVWITSKLGCVGKFCIVAKPTCQLLSCLPSANQTLIRVEDTKALEEICEIQCDSDYCGTKEIDNQPDQ